MFVTEGGGTHKCVPYENAGRRPIQRTPQKYKSCPISGSFLCSAALLILVLILVPAAAVLLAGLLVLILILVLILVIHAEILLNLVAVFPQR